MRLAFALPSVLSMAVLAQPVPEPPAPAEPAATAPARPPTATPARGSAGLTLPVGGSTRDKVLERAALFFRSMQRSDARQIIALSTFPFFLENRRYDRPDALLPEWARILRAKRTDLLTVYGIEVYTLAEMEQKFGQPPLRLKDVPLAGSLYVAVANLSGHAAVLVFRDAGGTLRAVAYTD